MSYSTTSSACKASCFLCVIFGIFYAFDAFGRLRKLERKFSLALISYDLRRYSLVLVLTEQL